MSPGMNYVRFSAVSTSVDGKQMGRCPNPSSLKHGLLACRIMYYVPLRNKAQAIEGNSMAYGWFGTQACGPRR